MYESDVAPIFRSCRIRCKSRWNGATEHSSTSSIPTHMIILIQWPYTYDSCDVGTLANQSLNDAPRAAVYNPNGQESENWALSYLPGQRLSRCTCAGESHPGPKHTDGSFVGRSAPEIDIFEAQIDLKTGGHVSQSGQWAVSGAAHYISISLVHY
jgi:beta-glucanase (GH16 family)